MSGTRRRFIQFMFVIGLAVTACGARSIRGSGELVIETREVGSFDRIEFSGLGDVILTQSGGQSLSIETDDNVIEHIQAEVKNRTLTLGFERGFILMAPTHLVFRVGVNDIRGLSVSGSGDIEAETLQADSLEADISGSGSISISHLQAQDLIVAISGSGKAMAAGDAEEQDVSISGTGQYLAGELCSPTVSVEVSGAGNATVCATDHLSTDISGSGNVSYYGAPDLESSRSGTGSVNSLGGK